MKILKTLLAVLIIVAAGAASGQKKQLTVTGTITDEQGNPLAGALVTNKAVRAAGTIAAAGGSYSIAAQMGDTLQFLHIGYETVSKTVKSEKLDVTLRSSAPSPVEEVELKTPLISHPDALTGNVRTDGAVLEGVVVTGMGAQRKVAVTGAVSPAVASSFGGMAGIMTGGVKKGYMAVSFDNTDNEEYGRFVENRFVNVAKDPLSTFALEVDGASYSNARRMINQGQLPGKDAVRVEEFINYFSYGYEKPTGKDPLKVNYEVGPCPWNDAHKLVRIGVKAREIASESLPAANFVFLIDVSGSMYGHNRLPLVISSLKLLVNNLRPEDRVAIVTYAGSSRVALESTPGSDKQKIREVLESLIAAGSTAGGEGLKKAYEIARNNYVEGGNNRIILATDGDFNVGQSSDEDMETLIERERKSGVFLTVLGYGMGNYKDKKLQVLAEKGNGNHAYIENLQEANKVLVNEFGGTLYTVAKDVKLQVEFNPARVSAFRLVGYESRLLRHEDFNDDTKDAGEVGAGHTVTALYEIVPVGSKSTAGSIDPLKYQPVTAAPVAKDSGRELMTVKIRYKEPDGDVSSKIEVPVAVGNGKATEDFRFVSAVAMFAHLLRDSDFKGSATYDKVIAEARAGLSDDPNGYRREFIRLAETAKGIQGNR